MESSSSQSVDLNCHVNFHELLEQSCLRDPANPSLCNHCNRKIAAHPRKAIQPNEELWICGLYIEELLTHDWTRHEVDRLKCTYCGQMIPNHPRRPFLPKSAQPPVVHRPAHLDHAVKRSWEQAQSDNGGAGAGVVMEMNPPAKRLSIQSPAAARLQTSKPPPAQLQLTPHLVVNRTTQVTPDDAAIIHATKAPQYPVAITTTTMPSQGAMEADKSTAPLTSDSGNQAIQEVAPSTTKQKQAPKQQSADAKNPWAKCIEQLDLETGEVLRIYPSGSDAAKLMKVSQGGISQCINGLRKSCYGFRWRAYDGPPINFAAIEDHQKSIAELSSMINIRGIKRSAETKQPTIEQAPKEPEVLQPDHQLDPDVILQGQLQRFPGMTYHGNPSSKCVEQLDLATKAVLRVYPSGTNAAKLMNIQTTGISLCINGKREEYYGFAWRLYCGPRIDFDAIEDKQTPLEELLKMKVFPKYYPPKPKPVEPITITAMANESVEISVLK
eukprot:gene22458-30715_t